MNSNFIAAEPVSQNLSRQIVSQSSDKNRNNLRISILYQFPYAWLRPKERVRIVALVARAFGMKADDVAGALTTELRQSPHGILIKRALLRHRIFSRYKKRRIHRPPSHQQIDEHAGDCMIVKTSPQRKDKLLAPLRLS